MIEGSGAVLQQTHVDQLARPRESSTMYIQYVGFNVTGGSRIYNFDVIDKREYREFTVKIYSQAFRPAGLKLQDGPDICFTRLKQELTEETHETRAEAHMAIEEPEIREYLERGASPETSRARRLQDKTTSDR